MHASAITVLVVGLLATVVLSLGALAVQNNNEDRLLHQRAREVAAVVDMEMAE